MVPDFLSRNVVAAVEATGISIQQLQQNDPEIRDVQNILAKGVPFRERLPLVDRKVLEKVALQCDVCEGVVWYTHEAQVERHYTLYAPPDVRRIILRAAHESPEAGHGGVDRTLTRVRRDHWWPGMTKDVTDFVA